MMINVMIIIRIMLMLMIIMITIIMILVLIDNDNKRMNSMPLRWASPRSVFSAGTKAPHTGTWST